MTADVVPRWEWRTFGDVTPRFAGRAPEKTEESDEVYLLSPGVDENVKIRGGLMDVKALQQVSPAGLEQWKPVMKAAFPLAAADVRKIFEAIQVAAPPLTRAQYTLEQFLGELVEPGGRARAVNVHKTRAHFKTGGCLAEVADVLVGGRRTRTVAIEAEDPAQVIAAVREEGFDPAQNVNYTRGLRRLIGMEG